MPRQFQGIYELAAPLHLPGRDGAALDRSSSIKHGRHRHHMDWSNTWFQNSVFTLLGILAGWGISVYFAHDAAKDTERQTRMLTTLLETAEQNGLVKLARDAKGEITGGRVIELRAAAQSTTSASGDLTTGPRAANRK
jgi:hypothetical protein